MKTLLPEKTTNIPILGIFSRDPPQGERTQNKLCLSTKMQDQQYVFTWLLSCSCFLYLFKCCTFLFGL